MKSLASRKVYIAWIVLVGLTIGSWGLSFTRASADDGQAWVAIAIFALAAFKIRLVGLHFMELDNAPLPLRIAFEAFSLVLFGVLTACYLVA
ncbi:cytochrome C oxidase subunit IV family protein [Mycolicibacterium neoaurum]|uniref:cytochrome C oxidase subunit IV family protein n=1 Tax=Mycolicibacterium neoaurum TaxID=1795 RepID=UPI0026710F06|nr:cytochrome C oxidase subunit IV family protein [Mycolicibacterium neoaurum]MDO3402769.1 cytochrome C oxidase subunit IV family protein [Mycolicibacterium neoaurum]